MCVPPCEVGVKPMPPRPASRPECMRISPTRATEISTWRTARTGSTPGSVAEARPRNLCTVEADDARARIQKLILTGDNRLKQGVDLAKVRESYEQALADAREAGLEERIRP